MWIDTLQHFWWFLPQPCPWKCLPNCIPFHSGGAKGFCTGGIMYSAAVANCVFTCLPAYPPNCLPAYMWITSAIAMSLFIYWGWHQSLLGHQHCLPWKPPFQLQNIQIAQRPCFWFVWLSRGPAILSLPKSQSMHYYSFFLRSSTLFWCDSMILDSTGNEEEGGFQLTYYFCYLLLKHASVLVSVVDGAIFVKFKLLHSATANTKPFINEDNFVHYAWSTTSKILWSQSSWQHQLSTADSKWVFFQI